MDLATVFTKTRAGIDAQFDPRSRLSTAFRKLLTAIDGKLSLEDLLKQFSQLSEGDMRMWASELVRLKYIEPVSQFEQPPAQESNYVYEGYVEMTADPEFKKTADEVSRWMRTNVKAEEKTPEAELMKTSQMAILQADTTIGSMQRSGFFLQPPEVAPPAADAPARKHKVLIVEDDSAQMALLRTIVRKEGHEVETAGNRAEVLAALNRLPYPELILLDVELPDVNGFQVLEKIRQHPTLKDVRVIMVTSRVGRADIAKGVLLGADGYITKPYQPVTMMAAIRQALGQAPATA
jgi:CheY-like chemotaxis protein